MAFLKPTDELVISAALVAIEYGIFSQGAPNLADVRADEPSVAPGSSSMNTYKAVNTSFITAIGVTTAFAALGKSRTVFIIGGCGCSRGSVEVSFPQFRSVAVEGC